MSKISLSQRCVHLRTVPATTLRPTSFTTRRGSSSGQHDLFFQGSSGQLSISKSTLPFTSTKQPSLGCMTWILMTSGSPSPIFWPFPQHKLGRYLHFQGQTTVPKRSITSPLCLRLDLASSTIWAGGFQAFVAVVVRVQFIDETILDGSHNVQPPSGHMACSNRRATHYCQSGHTLGPCVWVPWPKVSAPTTCPIAGYPIAISVWILG